MVMWDIGEGILHAENIRAEGVSPQSEGAANDSTGFPWSGGKLIELK